MNNMTETTTQLDDLNIDHTEAEITNETIIYDTNAVQRIALKVEQGNETYKLYHHLKPLSPQRYIQFEKEVEQTFKGLGELSTEIYEPKRKLGIELIENAEGYEPSEEWRELIGLEIVQTINALFFCEIAPTPYKSEKQKGFNPNADSPVYLKVYYSGADVTTAIYFRPPTQAEINSFYRIDGDKPDNNQLASHAKKPKAQRLYELGVKMVTRSENYADKIPVWHIAKAIDQHFLQYHSRVGKH